MIEIEYLTFAGVVLVVAELTGLLFALDVVMRPRSSQGTIAWFIALITMPLITVPLYLFLGRTRFHGYTEAIREKQSLIGKQKEEWFSNMNALAARPQENLEAIKNVVRSLTRIPFTRGNQVKLLVDGETTYRAMIEAIGTAESYVFVQFYIVRDDTSSRRIRNALIEKARAGVRVHFLYDEIGSIKLPDSYLEVMRNESIEVSGFKTTKGRNNRFQINFRNHRKLLIVDGRTGFIGGHNLGDEYLLYRDTHMRIDGPAAQQIQLTFLKDWFWATGEIPQCSMTPEATDSDDRAVAIVNTGPADDNAHCSILFTTLVDMARHRLWITSPYFVPDDVMVRALQAAALRGVDVRIILPDKADQKFVELASFTYYGLMTNCGVRLFRYRERFMHQKVILVDDGLAGIGTVNLDNRSIYLNFEATGLVADEGFASKVESMLNADLECSEEVKCAHFDNKPLYFRVAARVARLASPLL
jgi:cardiolipin synthase A/B